MPFSTDIYESWREKQLEKYRDLLPKIAPYLDNRFTVLDIGIGKAWLEGAMRKKKMGFKEIIGVDVDEAMTLPQVKGVTYFITDNYVTARKFDLVICFDTLHLLKEPRKILAYSKNLVLLSLPIRFSGQLDIFRGERILASGEIGKEEKDYFILIKV